MSYPNPWPGAGQPLQPGVYPLRPLSLGEIFGSALKIFRLNFMLLIPLAIASQLLAVGVQVAVLSAYGDLESVAAGTSTLLPAHPTQAQVQQMLAFVGHQLVAVSGSVVIGLVVAPVIAALAASGAATAGTRTVSDFPAVLGRLRGRLWTVILTSLLAGLVILGGFVLLIVPGIVFAIALIPAGPVAALEGTRGPAALRRAAALSKGFRARLFGISLLAGLIGGGGALVVGALVGGLVRSPHSVGGYIGVQLVVAILSAVFSAWSSTVTAMLYIDLRIRREGLGEALARSVQPSVS